MKNHVCRSVFAIIVLVILPFLYACTNLAAVRTYADETKKLSSSFKPMLEGSTSVCVEKYQMKKLITSVDYDAERVEKEAAEMCAPVDENNQIIAKLNALLEQYADTLTALADERLPTYKKELDGLQASLGRVKRGNTNESLIQNDKLEAIAALAEFLSRIVTQQIRKNAIRNLLDYETSVAAICDALKDYAALNYKGWNTDKEKEIIILQKALKKSSEKEPLAARFMETLLLDKKKEIGKSNEAVAAFVKSVEELKKSHTELRLKFDKTDDKELIEQLVKYANEVSNLTEKIRDVF